MTNYEELKKRDRLLLVKIPPEHAKALTEKAKEFGYSREKLISIVLTSWLDSGLESIVAIPPNFGTSADDGNDK